MKKGLTEIVLVLDRSGSMSSTKDDAEGGLREFIRKQKLVPGQCDVTFYRFDNEIERVFDKKPIEKIEDAELALEPRGSTALLDAMAQAIDEVGYRLKNTPEDERPEKVYFVTITDGQENCSYQTTKHSVFNRVSTQRDKYQWEFVYIGSNQDAIATAAHMGISAQYSLSYSGTGLGTRSVYNSLASNMTQARSSDSKSVPVFSAEDRTSAMEK